MPTPIQTGDTPSTRRERWSRSTCGTIMPAPVTLATTTIVETNSGFMWHLPDAIGHTPRADPATM